jgi:hypothetical protein
MSVSIMSVGLTPIGILSPHRMQQRLSYDVINRTNDVEKKVPATKVAGRCVVAPADLIPHPEPVIWAQNGKYRFYYEKEYDVR